jgi:hypothetical protein
MELIIIQISQWVQLGVVLLLLLIAYKIIRSLRFSSQTVNQRIIKHGSEAKAKVLSAEPTTDPQHAGRQIKLLLQVEPERGRNFIVEIFTPDDDHSESLHSGSIVRVMYNPINRQQVVLIDKQ